MSKESRAAARADRKALNEALGDNKATPQRTRDTDTSRDDPNRPVCHVGGSNYGTTFYEAFFRP